MSEALDRAKRCLQIQDVFLRECKARLAEDFDPKYSTGVGELTVQFKHIVARSEVLNLESDDGHTVRLFRVYIDLGARWAEMAEDPATGSSDPRERETPSPAAGITEKALIEATYVAEYVLTEDLEKDALDAFALINASYHVWPYWREFLMSQAARMNLPKVAVPTMLLASNRNNADQ